MIGICGVIALKVWAQSTLLHNHDEDDPSQIHKYTNTNRQIQSTLLHNDDDQDHTDNDDAGNNDNYNQDGKYIC